MCAIIYLKYFQNIYTRSSAWCFEQFTSHIIPKSLNIYNMLRGIHSLIKRIMRILFLDVFYQILKNTNIEMGKENSGIAQEI